MAIKIAVANQKGGIGKTTTAICLANGLLNRDFKVLLIDTDPQCSSTGVYDAKIEDQETLLDLMLSNISADKCIQQTPMGDIIASDPQLKDAETSIKADADRYYHIKDSVEILENMYDYIIFDTPPGNGVMLGNVLCCADKVIMPITADKFGIQGMQDFYNTLLSYKKRINPNIYIDGILIIKYKPRYMLTKDLENGSIPDMVKKMNTKIYTTKIRECIKCQEAQALGVSLFDYDKNCTTAIDYNMFIEELLKN